MENKQNIKDKINKKNIISAALFIINTIFVVLAINLLSNNLTMVDTGLNLISTIYILLAILIINTPFKKIYHNIKEKLSFYKIITGVFIIILSFILLITIKNILIFLASISIFIIGLDTTLTAVKIKRKEFYFLSIFSLTYAIYYMLIQNITVLWHIIQRFSLTTSNIIGVLIGKPMLLGPTISGFWIIIIFLILLTTCFILSINKKLQLKRFIFITVTIIIIWIVYLIIIGFTEFTTDSDVINPLFILFTICFIPTFFYLFRSNITENKIINLNIKKTREIIKTASFWALIFLFFSSLIFTSFAYYKEDKSEEKTKIMFYTQNMLGTWDIPEYGRYGKEASGMFGLLPIYLNASGFQNTFLVDNITTFLNTTQPEYKNITRYVNITDYVKIIESKELKTDILQDVDIFVVININKSFTQHEKQVIWDFVEKGGSLLVLGDHTNVGGIQEPLNDLLKPVGISFRFDSALPLDSKFNWMNCYQFLNHPVTYNIKSFNEIQISVGASLNTSIDAIPFIIGRYSLSDEGDSENKDISYLGDYKYNPGEQIGDTILAASTYYKKGKVVVFGDTSTFQNSVIPYSYPFIYNVFKWLDSKETSTDTLLLNIIAIIFLITAIVLILFFKNLSIPHAFLPLVFILALIISTITNPFFISDMEISGNAVYIDASHNQRFNLEPFTEKSVNGLILNLNRNGYLPIILREFQQEKIKESKILILNAPTKSFTTDEVEFLDQYMLNGGFVILATGYLDKQAVEKILKKYELDILNIPLGPFPYVEENPEKYENEPRFVDSWPIVFNQNKGQSYYNFTWYTEYHLMVFVKHGTGGILLIGDSQYLLDKNIESIYDYWPGNIILLKNIIDEFQELEEKP